MLAFLISAHYFDELSPLSATLTQNTRGGGSRTKHFAPGHQLLNLGLARFLLTLYMWIYTIPIERR